MRKWVREFLADGWWTEALAVLVLVTLSLAGALMLVSNLSAQAGVAFTDGTRWNVSGQAIADNGVGTAASGTVTVLKSYVELDCQDANGCTVTISETGAREGMQLTVVTVSANAATFADTGGVTEIATAFVAGQYDVISYIYIGDRWVELARSNN